MLKGCVNSLVSHDSLSQRSPECQDNISLAFNSALFLLLRILVNLKRKIFYQKCHDPDCKRADFKSTEHPVPSDCLPCLVEEDYEDEELLRALEMVDEGTGVDTSTGGSETADDAWMQGDVTDEELTEAYDKLLQDENIT